MTARVASIVGMEPIAETIERFGIMDHTPREYSMALGTGETTPLRLTTAYAMLANGGKRIAPTLIDRVQDRNGATIFRPISGLAPVAPVSFGTSNRCRCCPIRVSKSRIPRPPSRS
jgi:membrane carboxypeptidase/penicillin-binding protein